MLTRLKTTRRIKAKAQMHLRKDIFMDTIAALRNRILRLCEERGMSVNKLATLCALPPSSIKNILYGKSLNPKLITIKMICDGLDITLGEFFATPEFDSLEQEIK